MGGASAVFRELVESHVERVPVLETLHVERLNGIDCLISQVVVKNIFTDFDRKLSRHLAVVRGEGFPRFAVIARFREKNAPGKWKNFGATQHPSVPHALRAVGERALSHGDGTGIRHRHVGPGAGDEEGTVIPLQRTRLNTLGEALRVCEALGESEFLDISGDFDVVLCRPPTDQRPVMIQVHRGSLSLPNGLAQDSGVSEHPIAGFVRAMAENPRAQAYIAAARHGLAAAKEAAVGEFRAAAEDQIMAFDRALRGRPLDGYLMDSALALVARLKAGLGDELRGLSEHARITALEWSAAAEFAHGTNGSRLSSPTRAIEGVG